MWPHGHQGVQGLRRLPAQTDRDIPVVICEPRTHRGITTVATPTGPASIDHPEATWRSIDELCAELTEEEWHRPTGCPGWTVKDNISHLIDYEAGALGRPRPDHTPPALPHVKNPLGEANEVGVDARRSRSGQQVVAELREVAAERLAQLRALTDEDFAQEDRHAGRAGTLDDMLTLRVMDTWSHGRTSGGLSAGRGQSVGRRGHGLLHPLPPAARGQAGQGTRRRLGRLRGGRGPARAHRRRGWPGGGGRRAGGRADRGAHDAGPDAGCPRGGRTDAPDDVVVRGDQALGAAVIAALGFLP